MQGFALLAVSVPIRIGYVQADRNLHCLCFNCLLLFRKNGSRILDKKAEIIQRF